MAKGTNFNVSLTFQTNTKQAETQLRNLQKNLTSIQDLASKKIAFGDVMSKEFREASEAASFLKRSIQDATSVDTGKLDLSKFNQSLKASGKDISHYARNLAQIGPEGRKAFQEVAMAITNAEIPVRRMNAVVDKLWNSLKNVATWQISSAILTGFTSTLSEAYNYSKDLNHELNQIRIVTGYNTDHMAKFAVEANRAAKALSSTTKEYAKASLIYFQQGLNDAEVKKRTDVTIKMANVTGTAAQQVSDQMTAIWNNFDDGSKSLEYYADVLTALGAATASSTDEISQGLEKFAAAAQTVGLSYEYATAALATVTAETRQSADVVGNAFKTLFSRLQGLNLGETQDDGTTLNKYSEALAKVGVSIKDQYGQVKDMNTILDELGARWGTLTQEQKLAVAQTTAGVRQYTQLIALMDNWGTFQDNLNTATSSTGALNKQAEIYAESWDAAEKRVKASAEAIYDELLNDEFFIKLTNTFADFLDTIKLAINSLGGLKGVLSGVLFLVTKFAGDKILFSINQGLEKLNLTSAKARQEAMQIQRESLKNAARNVDDHGDGIPQEEYASNYAYRNEAKIKLELLSANRELTESEQHRAKIILQQGQAFDDEAIRLGRLYDQEKKRNEEIQKRIDLLKKANSQQEIDSAAAGVKANETKENYKKNKAYSQKFEAIDKAFQPIGAESTIEELNKITASLMKESKVKGLSVDVIQEYIRARAEEKKAVVGTAQAAKELAEAEAEKTDSSKRLTTAEKQVTDAIIRQQRAAKKARKDMKELAQGTASLSKTIMDAISATSGLAMSLSGLNSIIDTWNDEDLTFWEKFTSILMSVGFILPTLISTFKTLKTVVSAETVVKLANAAASFLQAKGSKAVAESKQQEAAATKKNTAETNKETASKAVNKAVDKTTNKNSGSKFDKIKNFFKKQPEAPTEELTEGTFQKGKRAGQTYYKQGNKFISKADYDALKSGKKLPKNQIKLNPGTIKTIGMNLGAAAVAAVAVAGATMALKAASDYYNRHEIAAQKAAESAKRLKEEYQLLKAEENEFRENISNYDSAKKGLEDLEKGTSAYREQIQKANEAALELLKTNKDLSYTIDSDGLIQIDEKELEAQKQESLKKERLAQYTSMQAEQDARTKQLEADKVEFNREQARARGWDTDDSTALAGGGLATASLAGGGALLATGAIGAANFWNPVGWALLAAAAVTAIGTTVALISEAGEQTESEQKALEAMAAEKEKLGRDLTKEEIQSIAKQYDSSGNLGKSLTEDSAAIDALNKLTDEMLENTAALRRNSEIILGQEFGGEQAQFLVDTYDAAYKEKTAELETLNKNVNRWEDMDNTNEAHQFINEYTKWTGKTLEWDYHVAANTDENREYIYWDTDENGERVQKTMSYQSMIQEIATAYAIEMARQESLAVSKMLSGVVDRVGANTAKALASWTMTKNSLGENVTANNFKEMQAEINANGVEAYLTQAYGMSLDSLAKELGYRSTEALIHSFETAMNDKRSEFEAAINNVPEAIRDSFRDFAENDESMGELTASAQREISDSLISAYSTGGETGYNLMMQLFKDAGNSKELQDLSSALSTLNWKEASPEELIKQINDLGISTSLTSAEIESFIGLMTDGVVKLTSIGKDYAELLSALENGATNISAEQYTKMAEAGLASYFTYMYDGTYQLIDAAQDFSSVLKENMVKNSIETLNLGRERLEEIKVQQAETEAALAAIGVTDVNSARDQFSDDLLFDGMQGTTKMVDGKAVNEYEHAATQKYVTEWVWDGFAWGHNEIKTVEDKAAWTEKTKLDDSLVDAYNARIDYIQAMGIIGEETANEWRNSQDLAATEKEIIEKYLPQAYEAHEKLAGLALQQQYQLNQQEKALASAAESAQELNRLYTQGYIGEVAYYDQYQAVDNKESVSDLNVNDIQAYGDHLVNIGYQSGMFSDNLANNAELASEVARDIMRMDNGIKKLSESYEEWNSILLNSNVGSQEFGEALTGMKNAISDLTGVSEDFVRANFLMENMDLIAQAAAGAEDAIDSLRRAIAKDIVINLVGDNVSAEIKESLLSWTDEIADYTMNVEIGASVDDSKIIEAANGIVSTAKMTMDQANQYFEAIGYEPVFEMHEVDYTEWVPTTVTEVAPFNGATKLEGATATQSLTYESGGTYIEHSKWVPVMSEDGTGLKIKTLNKTVSGKAANTSSANKGGKKTDTGKTKRYHEVDERLSDLNRQYDKISKARDRAFGTDKINLFNEALVKSNEILHEEKMRLMEMEKYLPEDKAKLAEFGFTFDEFGRINNYDEVMQPLEGTERFKDAEEAANQYEETLNSIEDQYDKIAEKENELFDLKLEKIEYTVQLKVELDEDSLKKIEFQLSGLKDPLQDATDTLVLFDQKMAHILSQADTYKQGFMDIVGANLTPGQLQQLMGGDFSVLKDIDLTQEQYDKAKDFLDKYLETVQSAEQLQDEFIEKIISTWDVWEQEFDDVSEKFAQMNSMLETYKSIIDLVGKENLGVSKEMIQAMTDAQVQIAEGQLKSAQAQMELYQENLENYKKLRAEAQTEEEIEYYNKLIDAAEDKYAQALQDRDSAWVGALQVAADAFKSAVDTVIETFEESLSGIYGSFEELQNAFDQQKEISERYLADYERIYELSKLNRDINESLNDTDSIAGKKALRDLQKQINAMQASGVEISKNDLDFLRKRYELRVAEIALEDAQKAKNQVSMRRDSEGNWSYVYTANADANEKAAQDYEDKMFALVDSQQEYIANVQANILKIDTDMSQALASLNTKDEDYLEKAAEIAKYYTDKRTYYVQELEKAIGNSKTIYEEDWLAYKEFTNYKLDADSDWITEFKGTRLAELAGYKSVEDMQNQFTKSTQKMMTSLRAEYNKWKTNVSNIMIAAGSSIEKFGKQAAKSTKDVTDETQRLNGELTLLSSNAKTAFYDLQYWANYYKKTYLGILEDYRKAGQDVLDIYTEIKKEKAALEAVQLANDFADWQTTFTTQLNQDNKIKDKFGREFSLAELYAYKYFDADDVPEQYKDLWNQYQVDNKTEFDNAETQRQADFQAWLEKQTYGDKKSWDAIAEKLARGEKITPENWFKDLYDAQKPKDHDTTVQSIEDDIATDYDYVITLNLPDGTKQTFNLGKTVGKNDTSLSEEDIGKLIYSYLYNQEITDENGNKTIAGHANTQGIFGTDATNLSFTNVNGLSYTLKRKNDIGSATPIKDTPINYYGTISSGGTSRRTSTGYINREQAVQGAESASTAVKDNVIKDTLEGANQDKNKNNEYLTAPGSFNYNSISYDSTTDTKIGQENTSETAPLVRVKIMSGDKKGTITWKRIPLDTIKKASSTNSQTVTYDKVKYQISSDYLDVYAGSGWDQKAELPVYIMFYSGDNSDIPKPCAAGTAVISKTGISSKTHKEDSVTYYEVPSLKKIDYLQKGSAAVEHNFYNPVAGDTNKNGSLDSNDQLAQGIRDPYNHWLGAMLVKQSDVNTMFNYKKISFDTGGYTGEWGPDGRMAMLHQKEIVLNAHDTENFLSAINIVRDIAQAIDLRAAAQQSMFAAVARSTIGPTTTQNLSQDIKITAEFPNATDRHEIEEAFKSLTNYATQFANRKN